MNKDTASQGSGSTRMKVEFDLLADEDRMLHTILPYHPVRTAAHRAPS